MQHFKNISTITSRNGFTLKIQRGNHKRKKRMFFIINVVVEPAFRNEPVAVAMEGDPATAIP
jgi:hypothetical protein